MPLKVGSSQETISANIEELIKAGHAPDQAQAIAEAEARKTKDAEDAEAARRTRDHREATAVRMRDRATYYTTQQLGKTRRLTPEGFLICEGVPVARIGEQVYTEKELNGGGEITIRGNIDGIVVVRREAEEVFRAATLASGEGKPATVEHPNEFVTPETYKAHSVGHAQNLRRGTGIEDDLLLADLVITDPEAIAYANRELPEISVGYSADYVQDEPGIAYQRNIVINHFALVERGRAGPRVSIRDSLPIGEPRMKLRDVLKLFLPSLATNDAAAVSAALDTDVAGIQPTQATQDSAVLVELQKLNTRLDTVDAKMKDLSEKAATKDGEETEEERKAREAAAAKKSEDEMIAEQEATGDTILEAEGPGTVVNLGKVYTGDSAGAKPDAYKEIVARAEILAPGITIPTKDSLKGTKGTALAGFMRSALETCATTDAGKPAVGAFLLGKKVADLKGVALLGAFNGAAELMRARNNRATGVITSVRTGDFSKPTTIANINESNRKFWANGGK